MNNKLTLKQLIAPLERTVAALPQQLATQPTPGNRWEGIAGSFNNEPKFDEALKSGKALRDADRSADGSTP